MTSGSYGFKSHPRHFLTTVHLDFLVFKPFIFILCSVSLLFGELDTDNDGKKVKIKGEALGAHQVLEQLQSQLDLKIQLDVPDTYGFKQSYDHHVTVEQVIQAVVDYYRDFNKVNLELLKRGKHRIILRERLERKPEPVPAVEDAKKRVESETLPDESVKMAELEEPQAEEGLSAQKAEPVSDPVISKLKFEVSDLVSLDTHKKASKKVANQKVQKVESKPLPEPKISEIADLEMPSQELKKAPKKEAETKSSSRVLKVELVGERLIDLDDEVLDQKSKDRVSKKSLEKRLQNEVRKESFISDWKKRQSSEWNAAPAVELGYFGAYSPWQKPSLLSYQPIDAPRGQLKVSLGTGTSEEISQPFDGIDVRTEKLFITYDKGLSEELKAHVRGGLINHDGELSVAGVVYDFESTGLSDIVIGLNYMPQNWTDFGNFSFGLDLSLPTGDDDDFAGSGGLGFVTSAGYHASFGRWRGQTQINLAFINEYDAFTLGSKSTVFSYDLGVSYYINKLFDLGVHAHWSESPWEKTLGIWGKDAFSIQTVLQTLAWTDPVSLYVDVGLSGAAPEFGLGVQWFKDFQ